MDYAIELVNQWGYMGLLISAFIAGSVVPLSSEAILSVVVLPPFGLDPVLCLFASTVGNVLGGLTCYWMGTLGNMEWIVKYFHVKPEKLERAQKFIGRRGAWFGLLAWIPILGTAISIALGYMRANLWGTIATMFIGKGLRYAAVIWGAKLIASLF